MQMSAAKSLFLSTIGALQERKSNPSTRGD